LFHPNIEFEFFRTIRSLVKLINREKALNDLISLFFMKSNLIANSNIQCVISRIKYTSKRRHVTYKLVILT